MLKLTQKTFIDDKTDKVIAYVECLIINGLHDYRVTFDKNTKKRANNWFRSLGFRIGEVYPGEEISDRVVEL